jgi:hypothetical protein
VRVQVAVAQSLHDAEGGRVAWGESVIPAPLVRVNTSPSVITALAKSLSLDKAVEAMRNQLGIDHLQVSGAVLA